MSQQQTHYDGPMTMIILQTYSEDTYVHDDDLSNATCVQLAIAL